jgi:hypothetical protein
MVEAPAPTGSTTSSGASSRWVSFEGVGRPASGIRPQAASRSPAAPESWTHLKANGDTTLSESGVSPWIVDTINKLKTPIDRTALSCSMDALAV